MDIIIKSFNRPYYLERCLRSIYQFAQGEFQVRVLDDGTPPEYLARIQELFPEVAMFTSARYEAKVAALRAHVAGERPFDQRTIPTDLWHAHVAAGSEVFLLLEDDIWLTGPVQLDEVARQMTSQHLDLVKISWLGNDQVITGKKVSLGEQLEEIIPHIPLASELLVLDRFGMRSALKRLGLLRLIRNDFRLQLPVYTLYGVASAFFSRAYWLFLWDDKQSRVDEVQQLQKAGQWYRHRGGRYAKSRVELTKTSFITSTTNMYKGVNLDIFAFNQRLNEAWLRGQLDVMQNFPQDFAPAYLGGFITASGDPRTTIGEWMKWIERFKAQYIDFGCKVD
ncbi:MAG: glycosyltransferase [Hymenobacter sp.]|nr:MAG: glycosyltransferase [Hymenobacter sp.]